MKGKIRVVTCCAHFDQIVNYDFFEEDILTKKLIQYYQDYVFNLDESDENLVLIKDLDEAIYKYTEDYHFAKRLKEKLDVDVVTNDNFAYLDKLMEYIIAFFKEYDDSSAATTPTRWI